MKKSRFNVEEVHKCYMVLGNVHKVGKLYGISGETVRKHLLKAKLSLKRTAWTAKELSILFEAYRNPNGVDLPIAGLNRSRAAIACKADSLKITSRRGEHVRTERMKRSYRDREARKKTR